ncbi:hypothetical protein [Winogradskyella sp.]|uniref:hypothetical protein n=1 Tax=Winogradskyella sp. TaxID=1883156 RepID=UPI002638431F|nr:hypothetical protein [Winogradskyella sp.]
MRTQVRNIIFFLFTILFCACNDKAENSQVVELYNSQINIPLLFEQVDIDSCKNIYSFKHSKDYSQLEFKLCEYGLKSGRQTFENLNKFFEEECELLKEEIPEAETIASKSKNNKTFFIFTHDFKIGNKHFRNNYIAYENYYLTIRFESTNQVTINELKNTLEKLYSQDLSNKINSKESNEICYNCKSPLFW